MFRSFWRIGTGVVLLAVDGRLVLDDVGCVIVGFDGDGV